MYKDYLNDIVKTYYSKVKNGTIAQGLLEPTPNSIKDECVLVFKTRFDKKDLRTIIPFFKVEEENTILRSIERCDRDRFRPLCNFLSEATTTTRDLNLELLGWLIDFPKRPYKEEDYADWNTDDNSDDFEKKEIGATVLKKEETEPDAGGDLSAGKVEAGSEGYVKERSGKIKLPVIFFSGSNRQKTLVIVTSFLLLAISVFYLMIRFGTADVFANGQQKCMIWVGDHYIPSSCEPRRGDTLVVAFDAARLKNFKRITRPDTITLASENKVWYIKRNTVVEYYTAGGRHPVDPTKVLRPLSRYMILKYGGSQQ